MAKFKKGDRVRYTGTRNPEGKVGTVFNPCISLDYDVVFDDFENGHSGDSHDDTSNHWYCEEDSLELIESKPEEKKSKFKDRDWETD